jgi:hypothetical protein
MARIINFSVLDATIPSESESTNLSLELQAEAEVAHIIVNNNTYNGVVGPDRITWEFEPISIFRSEFLGDGEHELIVTANVYSHRMMVIDTRQVSIIVNILPIITEPTDYPEISPDYFIDIIANINDSLNYNGTSISFNGKVVTNRDEYQASYNFPSGSLTLDCGNITANHYNNLTLGSFNPTLTINANSNGTQTGKVSISGSNVLATIKDDPARAQKIYWGNNVPVITSTSADTLSALLTPSTVSSIFATEISNLEQMFTHDVFSSWNFDILPVNAVSRPDYNAFDKYAYVNRRTFPNIFRDGEYIVLETAHNYEIIVQDFNGVEQTIIPSTQIFARITHHNTALSLR